MVLFFIQSDLNLLLLLQTMGFTNKIPDEPFNCEFLIVAASAQDLHRQILSLKLKFKLLQSSISSPNDLILLERNEIEYDKTKNWFLFASLISKKTICCV